MRDIRLFRPPNSSHECVRGALRIILFVYNFNNSPLANAEGGRVYIHFSPTVQ